MGTKTLRRSRVPLNFTTTISRKFTQGIKIINIVAWGIFQKCKEYGGEYVVFALEST